jgi:hypothetical protein
LPSQFNLANSTSDLTTNNTTDTTTTTTNPLTQRPNFATQITVSHNNTQPFNTDDDTNQQQQQRRRQRRNRQQQYRNMNNNNRFAEFTESDLYTDNESNYNNDDDTNDAVTSNDNNNNKKQKKKQKVYLEPNRILRYMQNNFHQIMTARGNQAFVLAASSIYDEWARDNYDCQVWQNYLTLGTEHKHWAKEIIQRTKKRDDYTNTRFVQKKINQLTIKMAQANASITDLQIQLTTYWNQTMSGTSMATTASAASTTNNKSLREPAERLEKVILSYIQHCTQHVKKKADNKIQLAKAQMNEYKALQEFEKIATPSQWNTHLVLKQKMKIWNTKNKNYQQATKRVEYNLPPQFISKTSLTFKIDESIIGKDEAQEIYNRMRELTKEYRTQSMSLYLKSITREYEILGNEISNIINGFPKDSNDVFDDTSIKAFKHYHDLRVKRFNLEAEQSAYFLEEQRVEGEKKDQEILTRTLTRSLGADFSLQQ